MRRRNRQLHWVDGRTAEYRDRLFARVIFNPVRLTYTVGTNDFTTTGLEFATERAAILHIEAMFVLEHGGCDE